MPVSQLDQKSALVIIDLQKGIASLPTVTPSAQIIASSAKLAAAFRAKGQTVVPVNVTGGAPGRTEQPRPAGERPADWAELVADLNVQDTDLLITKQTWGAFTNTNLDAALKSKGVTQIFITGIATTMGVESTARFAHELGYNVVVVVDAVTDMNAEAHEYVTTKVFPKLGETATTDEVLSLLGA